MRAEKTGSQREEEATILAHSPDREPLYSPLSSQPHPFFSQNHCLFHRLTPPSLPLASLSTPPPPKHHSSTLPCTHFFLLRLATPQRFASLSLFSALLHLLVFHQTSAVFSQEVFYLEQIN